MVDIVAPQSIVTLLESIRTQVDVITTLSSGGLGVIIYTWARILGIFDDANLQNFKKPVLLAIPATAFLCSIVLGYLIGAQTTGYFTEVAKGMSANGTPITSAKSHYSSDYYRPYQLMMGFQLLASLFGILFLALWYICNVIAKGKESP